MLLAARKLALNRVSNLHQDGIIPYFDTVMVPLKGFLIVDSNPDSNALFNQCLDTLAR